MSEAKQYLGVERSDFCRPGVEVGVFAPPLELSEEFSLQENDSWQYQEWVWTSFEGEMYRWTTRTRSKFKPGWCFWWTSRGILFRVADLGSKVMITIVVDRMPTSPWSGLVEQTFRGFQRKKNKICLEPNHHSFLEPPLVSILNGKNVGNWW